MGDFSEQKIGLPREYFEQRDIFVDCRWPKMITIHPTANFGWMIQLHVGSHDPTPDRFGDVRQRPIDIEAHAWIASSAILHNCRIGEHAVVAIGSVVRGVDVPPYTMVEGNPARAIRRFNPQAGTWEPVPEAERNLPVRKRLPPSS